MARRRSVFLVVLFLFSLFFYGKEVSNEASKKASSSSIKPTRSKQKRQPLLGNPSKPLTNTNNNVEPAERAYYSSVVFSLKTRYDSLVGGRGSFSVDNNGTKVTFATGNLQYQASTETWRFASEQWETVGADNAQISASNENWIDLFGWGTSGYYATSDNCNTNYQPYASASAAQSSTCGTNNKYGYGPTSTGVMNLTGDFASYDWGVYNQTTADYVRYNVATEKPYEVLNKLRSCVLYPMGIWRVLSRDEWTYLFNTRKVEYGEKVGWCVAEIQGKASGLLLFPDGFSLRKYTKTGLNESCYGSKVTISVDSWDYLEALGCVFLPCTGLRSGTSVSSTGNGYYWSSTAGSDGSSASAAYAIYFQGSGTNTSALNTASERERYEGCAVRLVHTLRGNKIADYNVRVKPENDCSNYCKDVRTETKDTTVTLCDNENSFTWDMPGYKSKPVSLEGNATQQEFKDTLRTEDDLCDSIYYKLTLRKNTWQKTTRDTVIMPCDGGTSMDWTLGSNSREVSIPSGQTQTTFDDTLRTKDGCDSIIYNVTLRKKTWELTMHDTFVMPCNGNRRYNWIIPGYTVIPFFLEDNKVEDSTKYILRSKIGNCDSVVYKLTLRQKTWETETKDTFVMLCDGGTDYTWDMPGYKSKPVSLEGNATQQEFKDTLRAKLGKCDSIYYKLTLCKKTWSTDTRDTFVMLCDGGTSYTWDMPGYKAKEFKLTGNATEETLSDTLRATVGGCDSIYYKITLRKKTWSTTTRDTIIMPCDGATKTTWTLGSTSKEFELEGNATQQMFEDTLRATVGGCDSIYYKIHLRKKTWELTRKDTTVILKDGATSFSWKVDNTTLPGSLTANEAQKDFYDTLRAKVGGCDSVIYHLKLQIENKVAISVSDTRQVIFSPGNLQFQGSTGTWRFAEHQYDRCGAGGNETTVYWNNNGQKTKADNSKIAKEYAGWIDLFGWGTSGKGTKEDRSYPWKTSSTNSEYGPESGSFDAKSGDNRSYDWGYANEIMEGSQKHPAQTWRTPNEEEWKHILTQRAKLNGNDPYSFVLLRFGDGDNDTVTGVIIYPDGFTFANAGVSAITTGPSAITSLNAETWAKLETAGCVFLPGCAYRNGTSVTNNFAVNANYWSSSSPSGSNSNAYKVKFYFQDKKIEAPGTDGRRYAFPVRLVQNIGGPCDDIQTETRDTVVMPCDGATSFTWTLGSNSREVSIPAGQTQTTFDDTLRTKDGCDSIIYNVTLRQKTWELKQKDTVVVLKDATTSFTWKVDNRTLPGNLTANEAQKDFYDTLRSKVGNCDSIIYHLKLMIEDRVAISVSDVRQVIFASGNLQFQGSTKTWRFAEHQYDTIGSGNTNIAQNYEGWIDLFGWGTSGKGTVVSRSNSWMTSDNGSDYGPAEGNFDAKSGNNRSYDWGYANVIMEGTHKYPAGTWRTPTVVEWDYIINKRSVEGNKPYTYVTLQYASSSSIDGVIIYPDGFTFAKAGVTAITMGNQNNVKVTVNAATWAKLETAGCIFLPRTPFREGTVIKGNSGVYWSSTNWSSTEGTAQSFNYFYNLNPSGGDDHKNLGLAVRLVQNIFNPCEDKTWELKQKDTTVILNEGKTSFAWNVGYKTISGSLTANEAQKDYYDTLRSKVSGCDSIICHLRLAIAEKVAISVSDKRQVVFASGNLQFQGSTKKWRFAEHPYDIIGKDNKYIAETYDGWIDLFGWGTSGKGTDVSRSYPWMISTRNQDYGPEWSGFDATSGDNRSYDWGQNVIGSDPADTWRTLTSDEWDYMVNTRTVNGNKPYTYVTLQYASSHSIDGVIVYPDVFTFAKAGVTAITMGNQNNAKVTVDATTWAKLETAGCIFLPRTPLRHDRNVDDEDGIYWSSTYETEEYAQYIGWFNDLNPSYGQNHKMLGFAVRLVQNIFNPCDLIEVTRRDTTVILKDGATSFAWNAGGKTIPGSLEDNEAQKDFYDTLRSTAGCDSIFYHLRLKIENKVAISVANDRQVIFSPGNLQFQGSTKTWRFAEHQYDLIGNSNTAIAENYAGWIDLFGWGTSGKGTVVSRSYPWMTADNASAYGPAEGNFDAKSGANRSYDWGYANEIYEGNLKHPARTWRTLTSDEWDYIINRRKVGYDGHNKYTFVNLQYSSNRSIDGVIIYPDYFSFENAGVMNLPLHNRSTDLVEIDAATWAEFETAGCVFLPLNPFRVNRSVNQYADMQGLYWSATNYNEEIAKSINWQGSFITENNPIISEQYHKYLGFAVRLVQNVGGPCGHIQTETRDTLIMPCDGATSFTWTMGSNSREVSIPAGQTQTTFEDTLRSVEDCDSVIYKVTFRQKTWSSNTIDTTVMPCDGSTKYTWNMPGYKEREFKLTGTATREVLSDTLRSKVGNCDSIYYNLTLIKKTWSSNTIDTTVMPCDGSTKYTWNMPGYKEREFKLTGTATREVLSDTLRSKVGNCDSIYYNLTLYKKTWERKEVPYPDAEVAVGEAYQWALPHTTKPCTLTKEEGDTFKDTLRSTIGGCDSIIYILKLNAKSQHLFSITEKWKVAFAPGNLQYCPKQNKWRFAERQFDRCGAGGNESTVYWNNNGVMTKCDNTKASADYEGWIDLFAWGTSGVEGAYPPYTISSQLETSWSDWGQNVIGNDPPNKWRTAKDKEWEYLLDRQINNAKCYSFVCLQFGAAADTLYGVILYPDDFTWEDAGVEAIAVGLYRFTKITASYWEALEKVGCVFLPTLYEANPSYAGKWDVNTSLLNRFASYWCAPATIQDEPQTYAYHVRFNVATQSGGSGFNANVYKGLSVRLILNTPDPCGYFEIENRDTTVVLCDDETEFVWEDNQNLKFPLDLDDDEEEYKDTLRTAAGCDSIYSHVTLKRVRTKTVPYEGSVAIGDGYIWDMGYKTVVRKLTKEKEDFYDTLRGKCGDSIISHLTLTNSKVAYFSIGGGKKVKFSSGNLQYCAAQKKWRFAERQFDRCGAGGNESTVYWDNNGVPTKCNNMLASATYGGWIDLFSWGASGYEGAPAPYELISTKIWSDWGQNVSTENSTWRTPTEDDWANLLGNRTVNGGVGYSFVTIQFSDNSADTVSGLLLYHDDFTWESAGVNAIPVGIGQATRIDAATWNKLDKDGCVFLPSASRVRAWANQVVMEQTIDRSHYSKYGYYWTSTYHFSQLSMSFTLPDFVNPHGVILATVRHSVRLVQDVDLSDICKVKGYKVKDTTVMDCNGGTSFTWNMPGYKERKFELENGETHREFFDTLRSKVDGCDSIIYHVDLYKKTWSGTKTKDTTIVLCNGGTTYTSVSGKEFKLNSGETKQFKDTLRSKIGNCDSIYYEYLNLRSLKVTINKQYATVDKVGDKYLWDMGYKEKLVTFTKSGGEDFYDTLRSTVCDCDSIISHLKLFDNVFSISSTQKVLFAPGNLQYRAVPESWRFAEHQFDRCGKGGNESTVYWDNNGTPTKCDNSQISSTYAGWIDLFAWGASGLGGSKPPYATTGGALSFYWSEWGGHKIGDDPPQMWRTLTQPEWEYVLTKRTKLNGNDRYSYVRLKFSENNNDTVTGVVVYPDAFTFEKAGVSAIATGASAGVTPITAEVWQKLEKAGCAFLPGASRREGKSWSGYGTVSDLYGISAHYWSSTEPDAPIGTGAKVEFFFEDKKIAFNTDDRPFGNSVRLVLDFGDRCKTPHYVDTTVMPCDGSNSYTWKMPGYKERKFTIKGNANEEVLSDTLRTKDGLCDSIIYVLTLKKLTLRRDTYRVGINMYETFNWDLGYKTIPCKRDNYTNTFHDTLRSAIGGCDSVISVLCLSAPYFSVSATQKVEIAPGNLQYRAAPTAQWRFATNQYDRCGLGGTETTVYYTDENGFKVRCDNSKASATYTGWIDVFEWGCSGYGNNANPPYYETLDRTLTWSEWGQNTISGYSANTWRTPTSVEWQYLLKQRQVKEASRYTLIKVNSIRGMLIYPDNFHWSVANMNPIAHGANITKSQWQALEKAGCAFLPDAGTRKEFTNATVYWTSTAANGEGYCVFIEWYNKNGVIDPTFYEVYDPTQYMYGEPAAVRLIRNVTIAF